MNQAIRLPAIVGNVPAIYGILKGISDYGHGADRGAVSQYAHSERAVILCLLYDDIYSLDRIVNDCVNNNNIAINNIVIQIKPIHPRGMCNSCGVFLDSRANIHRGIDNNNNAWNNWRNNIMARPILQNGNIRFVNYDVGEPMPLRHYFTMSLNNNNNNNPFGNLITIRSSYSIASIDL